MNHVLYFWMFFKAALLSTGGMGNFPSLHDDFLSQHWATDHDFAESLTIGQVAPGPNGLWVVSLGYLTAGVPGSLLALTGTMLPPLLVLIIERIYRKIESHPAVSGFIHGLTLAICGVFLVVLASILRSSGIDVKSSLIAVVAVLLTLTRKLNIPTMLALAAIAGILF